MKEIVSKTEKLIKQKIHSPSANSPYVYQEINLCFSQLTSRTIFSKEQKFKIYHKVNCESEYVIYLMECIICNKQYVGKAENGFNIRLNKHRKDTKDPNSILACRHLQQQGHNFNKQAKFMIGKLVNTSSSKKNLRDHLIQRENF